MENWKRCLPYVLTALGIVGVGTTSYFTAKATIKSVREVDEAEKAKGEPLTNGEKIKLCYKNYIVPAVTGIGTAASIGGAAWMSKKREMSIIGAATLASGCYKKYKKSIDQTVDKVLPEDIKQAFKKEQRVAEVEEYKKDPTPEPVRLMPVHDGERFACVFRKSDYIFETTYEQLLSVQLYIRDRLEHEGYVTMEDIYKYLEVDHIPTNSSNIGLDIDKLVDDGYNGCMQFGYVRKLAGDVEVLEIQFVGTVEGYDGITIDPVDGIPYDLDHLRLEPFNTNILA